MVLVPVFNGDPRTAAAEMLYSSQTADALIQRDPIPERCTPLPVVKTGRSGRPGWVQPLRQRMVGLSTVPPSRALGTDQTMKNYLRGAGAIAVVIEGSQLPSPVLSWVGDKRWRLEADYKVADQSRTINIQKGFVFDLSSVPRFLWWLIAPFELSISAPLIHDFLYQASHDSDGGVAPPYAYTRREVDRLFRRLMEEEGVPAWRKDLGYVAVRMFGGLAWRTRGKVAET